MNTTLKFKEMFGIDLRSLAIFRICMAFLIIADLVIRLKNIKAFYSDEGVLPRNLVMPTALNNFYLSLHLMNGMVQLQVALFLIAGFFAFLLLIGYHTRLANFISWILIISMQTRSEMILDGGDQWLRLMLFWCLFLPIGASYSIDSILNSNKEKPPKIILSGGAIALFLQFALVYWVTAAIKWHNEEWASGNGVYYSLHEIQYSSPIGLLLLKYLSFEQLKLLTYGVLWLETIGPFMLISPIFNYQMRVLALISFLFMQLGFGLCLDLEFFPLVSTVAMIPFIPGRLLDKFLPRLKNIKFLDSDDYVRNGLNYIKTHLPERPISYYSSKLSNILAAVFMVYVLLFNISVVTKKYTIPEVINNVGEALYINQWWHMFVSYEKQSPFYAMWYVIPAKLKDGTEVDLFKDGDKVSWERPNLVCDLYKDRFWKKYLLTMRGTLKTHLPYLAAYECREWNTKHSPEKQIVSIDFYTINQKVFLENKLGEIEKALAGRYYCPYVTR